MFPCRGFGKCLRNEASWSRHGPDRPPTALEGVTEGTLPQHGLDQDLQWAKGEEGGKG